MQLTKQDFLDFKSWLNFDYEAVTWEGKYTQEFEEFWDLFFIDNLSNQELISRFNFALKTIKTGTLNAWFGWVFHKFYCYLYVKKNYSILELSEILELSVSETSIVLRNFFVERYPEHEKYFNETFHNSNILSPGIHLKFSELNHKLNLGPFNKKFYLDNVGCSKEDVMVNTEVTLYPEWRSFLFILKNESEKKFINLKAIQTKDNFKKVRKFILEVFIITSVTTALILLVHKANDYYEKNLVDKIGIYEPEFLWLDKNLTYKQDQTDSKAIEADLKALEELAKATQSQDLEFKPEDRFDTESEVVLTSLDKISEEEDFKPKAQEVYEENQEGYRDTQAAGGKVYRLLLKSVEPMIARGEINQLMTQYGVTQVDKVKPGTVIPGGIYYNLHVPKNKLPDFLKRMSLVTDLNIYESRVRSPSPPGKVKVFIWIKDL
jgi:hypothetical protein